MTEKAKLVFETSKPGLIVGALQDYANYCRREAQFARIEVERKWWNTHADELDAVIAQLLAAPKETPAAGVEGKKGD